MCCPIPKFIQRVGYSIVTAKSVRLRGRGGVPSPPPPLPMNIGGFLFQTRKPFPPRPSPSAPLPRSSPPPFRCLYRPAFLFSSRADERAGGQSGNRAGRQAQELTGGWQADGRAGGPASGAGWLADRRAGERADGHVSGRAGTIREGEFLVRILNVREKVDQGEWSPKG